MVQDELRKLEDEMIRVKGELLLKDARIEELEHFLLDREEKLSELEAQMKILHESVAFKLRDKCSPFIDQCFPPRTSRRKILAYVRGKLLPV